MCRRCNILWWLPLHFVFWGSYAYYFGQHNYDDRSAESSFGQGFVSRGGIYADRVDDDKYGAHKEIDKKHKLVMRKNGTKIFT